MDNGYEMISGHRRKLACSLAGLETMPVIVRSMTDDEAVIAMVSANRQREQVLPSEKAFAYKMWLEAMNRQGKRTDLSLSPMDTKLDTGEMMVQETGESRPRIFRYIRLTNLIPRLLDFVDNSVIEDKANPQMLVRNEMHTQIGTEMYHICQFAEIMERNGNKYEPCPEPETVQGYVITDRMPVGDKVFVMAHNPNAANKFVTWQGYADKSCGYDFGHYWSNRSDAWTDCFRRADSERTGRPYDHTKFIKQRQDRSAGNVIDGLAVNLQRRREVCITSITSIADIASGFRGVRDVIRVIDGFSRSHKMRPMG